MLGAIETELGAGQVIFEAQDKVHWIYFPGNAILSVLALFADGRCAEALTIGNESAAGILYGLTGACTQSRTVTQQPGLAYKVPAEVLRELAAARPALLRALLGSVQQDFARAEYAVGCNALHSGTERLARWLLANQDRVGSGVPINITQEALALVLGVQRTTVTGLATRMRDDGAISYSRGKLKIIDRGSLKRLSCACYGMFSPDEKAVA
jgi:CRP-like cAMP-binding protein